MAVDKHSWTFILKSSSSANDMYGLKNRFWSFSSTNPFTPDFAVCHLWAKSVRRSKDSYSFALCEKIRVHMREVAHMLSKNESLSLYDFKDFEQNIGQNSYPFHTTRLSYDKADRFLEN